MLKKTSENLREFFILEFTKEIIRGTEKYREILIKKEVQEVLSHHEFLKKLETERKNKKTEKIGKIVQEKIKEERKRISNLRDGGFVPKPKPLIKRKLKEKSPFKNSFFKKSHDSYFHPKVINLPLPETVRDIRPIPGKETLNLEKLNPLVQDPLVKSIECNGPGQKIVVKGAMGIKNTSITLTEEDIDDVINKFSKASKIPVSTGVFKVVYGRLVLSAIISEVVDSKFIIKKMSEPVLKVPLPSR
ncbi:MAG: hypothetical protein WDZ62_00070 [Candidatus Pacearchaeota archaeon]